MQAIGSLGLPAAIIGLGALLIVFALYRSARRANSRRASVWSKRFSPAGLTAIEATR